MLLRPGQRLGDPLPLFRRLCPVTLHEVAIDVRGRARGLAVVRIGDDQRLLADRRTDSPDQRQTVVVIVPPVQHHAVHSAGLDHRPALGGHVATEGGVGEIEPDIAAFFPTHDQLPLLIAQPPSMALGQEALVRVPAANLDHQHQVRVAREDLRAPNPRLLDALRREPRGQPLWRPVPDEPEKGGSVPDQIVTGERIERIFPRHVIRWIPGLEDRRKGAAGNALSRIRHGERCPGSAAAFTASWDTVE